MSITTQLAEEIVNVIKEELPGLDVRRDFVPAVKLEQIAEKRILVVPREKNNEHISRSQVKVDTTIDVAYLYKFKKGDAAEIDPLLGEVEQIEKLLDGIMLEKGICLHIQNRPIYHAGHFRAWRQFTSILTLNIVNTRCF